MIHVKINLNDRFTVPGLAEMEIGLGRKIGSRKIGGSTVVGKVVLDMVCEVLMKMC